VYTLWRYSSNSMYNTGTEIFHAGKAKNVSRLLFLINTVCNNYIDNTNYNRPIGNLFIISFFIHVSCNSGNTVTSPSFKANSIIFVFFVYIFSSSRSLIPFHSAPRMDKINRFLSTFFQHAHFISTIYLYYNVKKVHEFPVSSRDVTNQTPPGQE